MTLEFQPITDQIVKLTIRGDISDEDGERFLKDIIAYRDSNPPDKQLLHYLVDSSHQGKLTARTRKIFTDQSRTSDVGKVAVFGSNRFVRVMATFMIKASGRKNLSIQFFETEDEALAWLQEVVAKETVS